MVEFFNPSQQRYATVPQRPGRPYLAIGQTGGMTTDLGQAIGYLRAILRFECGFGLTVAANPGPWTFTTAASDALKGVQNLFGLPATGRPDPDTWGALDACYFF